jgi:purine-nucleoside phosphorylase
MGDGDFFKFCYGCDAEDIAETVVITPVIPLKRFKEHCRPGPDFRGRLYAGFTAGDTNGGVTVINCGVGGALAGDAVMLLEGSPARRLLFVGSCGGLKDCRVGDLILAESAFDGEGFSRYHAKMSGMEKVFETGRFIPAEPEQHDRFSRFLDEHREKDIDLKKGDIFTIGSLLAERRENMEKVEEKGFRGVDMELSAVYCAAGAAGIKAAGLLFVSDLPLEGPPGRPPAPRERTGYDNAVGEAVRLSMEFARAV